jgi:hypothetical protein
MKHPHHKQIALFAVVVALLFGLAGCDLGSATGGLLYNEQGGTILLTDGYGNQLEVPRETMEGLARMSPASAQKFIADAFKVQFPADYAAPDAAPPTVVSEAEGVAPEVTVSGPAKMMADSLGAIPGWGTMASIVANGLLGLGAVWMRRRGSVYEKGASSMVRAIDTFRDVLDQTPQGEKIEAELVKYLREEKIQAGREVWKSVDGLIDRIQTQVKPRGGIPIQWEGPLPAPSPQPPAPAPAVPPAPQG